MKSLVAYPGAVGLIEFGFLSLDGMEKSSIEFSSRILTFDS